MYQCGGEEEAKEDFAEVTFELDLRGPQRISRIFGGREWRIKDTARAPGEKLIVRR